MARRQPLPRHHREINGQELRELIDRLAQQLGYTYEEAVDARNCGRLSSSATAAHLSLLIGLLDDNPERVSA